MCLEPWLVKIKILSCKQKFLSKFCLTFTPFCPSVDSAVSLLYIAQTKISTFAATSAISGKDCAILIQKSPQHISSKYFLELHHFKSNIRFLSWLKLSIKGRSLTLVPIGLLRKGQYFLNLVSWVHGGKFCL